MRLLVIISSLVTLVACLGQPRGTVVTKFDTTTARIDLGRNDVAVNDRVQLYGKECPTKPTACHDVLIADGTVTQVLDDHYSLVTFPAGTRLEPGLVVWKVQ